MNPKKKADLQRKLTLAQVPKPPADLADRLKRDIPPHLVMGASSEHDRFRRSVFFDVRVAASVLLVVTSAFFALQFFSRLEQPKNAAYAPRPVAASERVQPATLTAGTARNAEPVRVAQLPQPVLPEMKEEKAKDRHDTPARGRTLLADASTYNYSRDERTVVEGAAAAPPMIVAEAAPPPPAAPAPAPVAAPMPMSITVTASAPEVSRSAAVAAAVAPQSGLIAEARANDMLMKKPDAVFGISIDERAFQRIKSAIEHGEKPQSSNIDVAALVNYFAGGAKSATRDIRLEVEGSPAPVAGDPARRMVRVTVDTETIDVPSGASVPPIASNASIEADFDNSAVIAHHLVGGESSLTRHIEPALLKNTSVTAMYDVILAARGTSWQRVATFRLTYRAVGDGKEHTIERTLRRRDLAPSWIAATRRHRLASLGAVWGETLKGMAGANDVAQRAEELAVQAPEDAKARELANAASATSQLHGSASGSGGR